MDKFGIFNLLSGLFSYYQQNKAPFNSAEPPKDSSPSDEKASPSPKPSAKPSSTINQYKPLQAGMLNVMANHDAHYNRVMNQKRK